MEMNTVIDIWSGKNHTVHVARFIRLWNDEAIILVSKELANGFLVNVRREIAWGEYAEFDERPTYAKGLN